jgi:adenylate cyclase
MSLVAALCCSTAAEIAVEMEQPNDSSALRIATACNGIAGRLEEARKSLAHLRELDPFLSAFPILRIVRPFRAEDLARLTAGLRNAGLPE